MSIATRDAGNSIEIYPDVVGTEMDGEDGKTVYVIQTSNGLDYRLHTPFRGVPNLEQISQPVNGTVVASVSRPLETGEGAQIHLTEIPE